jgi:hypothetical protein
MDDPINMIVTDAFGVEHHWLATCPCGSCVSRREELGLSTTGVRRSITVEAAHLLGFIPKRSPLGSVAAQLNASQNPGDAP